MAKREIVVGGFDSARAVDSSWDNAGGPDFAHDSLKADIDELFDTTYSTSNTITSGYLDGIDLLVLSPVNDLSGTEVVQTPLSGAEQTAITSWVNSGGVLIMFGDNDSTTDQDDINTTMTDMFGGAMSGDSMPIIAPGDHTNGLILDTAANQTVINASYGDISSVSDFQVNRSAGWTSPPTDGNPLLLSTTSQGSFLYCYWIQNGALQSGSGAVLLTADVNFMMDIGIVSNPANTGYDEECGILIKNFLSHAFPPISNNKPIIFEI